MSRPPPSRYRVVERGRRLVVLDMLNGGAPVSHTPHTGPTAPAKALRTPAGKNAPVTSVAPETLDMRGRAIVTTHPFYDLKGPRRITVDLQQEEQIRIFKVVAGVVAICFVAIALMMPWLFVVPIALLSQRRARNWMRAQATDWLDGVDQAADSAG